MQELRQQLRVLLSWREQAERLKKPTATAENHFLRLREREAPRMREMGATLQMLLRRQKQTTGKAESEHLARQMAELRSEIAFLNHLLTNPTLDEVGGFLDVPLDRYPKLLKTERKALWTPWNARDRKQVAAVAVLLVVAVLAVLYLTLWRAQVRFEAIAPEFPNGQLRLLCINQTTNSIRISAPRDAVSARQSPRHSYGVSAFVREPGKKDFRLTPVTGAWTYNGTPTTQRDPVLVAPGMSAELQLDLARAFPPGIKADALRIACMRGDGAVVYTFTAEAQH